MSEVRVSDDPALAPPTVTVSSDPQAPAQQTAPPDSTETAAFEAIPDEPVEPPRPLPTYRLLCAIVLIIAAAFPLFFASIYTSNFFRYIDHQSTAQTTQTAMDRARSDIGQAEIRPAIAPSILFLLLECAAIFFVASMSRHKEDWSKARRITRAAFISLTLTALLQIPFWVLFQNPGR